MLPQHGSGGVSLQYMLLYTSVEENKAGRERAREREREMECEHARTTMC